jgi:hypothetical protein
MNKIHIEKNDEAGAWFAWHSGCTLADHGYLTANVAKRLPNALAWADAHTRLHKVYGR